MQQSLQWVSHELIGLSIFHFRKEGAGGTSELANYMRDIDIKTHILKKRNMIKLDKGLNYSQIHGIASQFYKNLIFSSATALSCSDYTL